MYVPPPFAVTDRAALHDFVERHSFGLLVSQLGGEPFATHLPFLLERDTGTLVGHVARANPQWRTLADHTVMVVFAGPHAYVSPTWYESPGTVPTWNYTAVHAYGRATVIEDADDLREIVRRTTDFYEASMPTPWTLPDDGVFVDRLLTQIVGFRVAVERLEGKFKLNQNHPAERRAKVAAALAAQGTDDATGVAELMRGKP